MYQTNNKIAIIGDKDSVLAFKAAGCEVFQGEQIKQTLKKLSEEKYAIVLITEELYKANDDVIKKHNSNTYPIIIPIPSSLGSSGYGMQQIKANVERALGVPADSIFNKEKIEL
ncbi:MAG: V-type ATP synthase subunit F [Firmicutes bacterium]|nr:V-type ATP synthase subunit F [Bacillota bacterium]